MTVALLTAETKAQIDQWLAKYPPEQKRSAVLAALHAVQKQNQGWISPELISAVAIYLGLEEIQVMEVATFYDMFTLNPAGKHKVRVCTNVSCLLNGGEELLHCVEKKLGIKAGQSTPDGKFELIECECLAACAAAPVIQINTQYYEKASDEKIEQALEEWKQK